MAQLFPTPVGVVLRSSKNFDTGLPVNLDEQKTFLGIQ